jgi:hypothetical protein
MPGTGADPENSSRQLRTVAVWRWALAGALLGVVGMALAGFLGIVRIEYRTVPPWGQALMLGWLGLANGAIYGLVLGLLAKGIRAIVDRYHRPRG